MGFKGSIWESGESSTRIGQSKIPMHQEDLKVKKEGLREDTSGLKGIEARRNS